MAPGQKCIEIVCQTYAEVPEEGSVLVPCEEVPEVWSNKTMNLHPYRNGETMYLNPNTPRKPREFVWLSSTLCAVVFLVIGGAVVDLMGTAPSHKTTLSAGALGCVVFSIACLAHAIGKVEEEQSARKEDAERMKKLRG